MIEIYGIKTCDTMKKARAVLDRSGIAYVFHDYKVEGIAADKLRTWIGQLGWEKLLNRAGTTFKKLSEAERQDLTEDKAIRLMLAQPSMIKRPVAESGSNLLVGFDAAQYAGLVQAAAKPTPASA